MLTKRTVPVVLMSPLMAMKIILVKRGVKMSKDNFTEYIESREVHSSAVPVDQTLFDEKFIKIAQEKAGLSNIDDSYAELNIIPPQPEYSSDPTEGASLNLSDRAVALKAIVKARSHTSQLLGADLQARDPGSSFSREYGNDTRAVIAGMYERQNLLDREAEFQLHVLNGTTAMKNAGFSDDDTVESLDGLQGELRQFSGTGKEVRARRSKDLMKVDKTASRPQD